MLALVSSGEPLPKIEEVEDLPPLPGQALVAVHASSLNRAEVQRLGQNPSGFIPGSDVAGVVLEPAADGDGPGRGDRVVGLVASGAWSRRVAVPSSMLARVPDDVSFEEAAAVPTAGLTAYRLLLRAGALLDRRVLVTGAAGGVGRFLTQLAARAGAQVSVVVGSPARGDGLRELGASEVLEGGMPHDGRRFHVILDAVGGASLSFALRHVAPGGIVITYGQSSGEAASVQPREFYGPQSAGASLLGFHLFTDLAGSASESLSHLVRAIARGHLSSGLHNVVSWTDLAEATDDLLNRKVAGKLVMRIVD